ncbi:hypothetical protein [Kingella kingae]|nr:hypothetical protein [Kingella kingae]MDK4539445.1 hypothetical protein [Kingella kingae]
MTALHDTTANKPISVALVKFMGLISFREQFSSSLQSVQAA